MIEKINIESAKIDFPQAFNCMVYFRKVLLRFIPDDMANNIWVAGGALRAYLSDEKISDIDLFSNDRRHLARLVIILRKELKFKPYIITKSAIKGWCDYKGKKFKVDVVKRLFNDPQHTLDNFDFTVCCFATDGTFFYYHKTAAFDLLKKRLVINNLPSPVDSLKRMQRYIQKGYFACNGTLLTIAKEISMIDSSDESIFEFYTFD